MRLSSTLTRFALACACVMLAQCAPLQHRGGGANNGGSLPDYAAALPSPGAPLPLPSGFSECEPGTPCATWLFNGTAKGKGSWMTGESAALTIVRYDTNGIVIRRVDDRRSTKPGFAAQYTGQLAGNQLTGDVVWAWPGHWKNMKHGKFTASLLDSHQAASISSGHGGAAQMINTNGGPNIGAAVGVMGAGIIPPAGSGDLEHYDKECKQGDDQACLTRDDIRGY